jgi:hypothetical protein
MKNHIPRIRENAMFAATITECIEACNAAGQLCEQCAMNSLVTGETRDDAVLRCLDCVTIANMAALVIGRGSPLVMGALALCAAACERCAEVCDEVSEGIWEQCGQACREAARSCRELGAIYDRRRAEARSWERWNNS